MSAGGPSGRTARRSLAGLPLYAGNVLHGTGSKEGATAGRTPAGANSEVVTFDPPAGARPLVGPSEAAPDSPWWCSRP